MNWIDIARECFDANKILYSGHAIREMREEEMGIITDQDVYEAVCNGEIIETYPDDLPYPSVLVFGFTGRKRPLHAVCAYNILDGLMIIVTVYQPDPGRWEDYKRRKTQ